MSLHEANQDSQNNDLQSEESEPAHFAAGLPGFEELKRFKFVSHTDMRPFLLLKSLDEPYISLPVINCLLVNPNLLSSITDDHLKLIGSSERNLIEPYYVLKVNTATKVITANTKAPIIIDTKTRQGYQILLDEKGVKVDEPLYNLIKSVDED
jgi:flagellar assembly factor FliW